MNVETSVKVLTKISKQNNKISKYQPVILFNNF